MEKDAAAIGPYLMTEKSDTLWKGIAIVLAIFLGVALICMALIMTGVMKLGLSLL
jgi:hypothetical protein